MPSAPLADPVGAAIEGPFHQLDVGRSGTLDRGVEQRAFLAFAGCRAAVGDDQVEPVIRPNLSANVDLRGQGAQIFARCLRRDARSPQRPI